MDIILKYSCVWVGLLVIAIINGAIREKYYQSFMTELPAHQLSTITGLVLFGIYIRVFTQILRIKSSGQALTIGIIWFILTITFEFMFGHYVMGHGWSRLLHDYNLLQGRLWVLVPLWIGSAPYIFYRFWP